MDTNLIYQKKYSIPGSLCNDIIKLFNKCSGSQYTGATGGGINTAIKNSTDLNLLNIHTNKYKDEIDPIILFLINELKCNLLNFSKLYNQLYPFNCFLSDTYYSFINILQIQHYTINVGHYVYHNDYYALDRNQFRFLTFIWYLNDVEIGGETEFFGNIKIKPKAGTLVIFPATWTYIHKANTPISNDKYILTGWIYVDYNRTHKNYTK